LEDDEDGKGADVNGISADLRDLGHGGPDHGTDAVAGDEESEAQRGFDLADAEFFDDVFGAGGVDCGADVDGEGEEADLEGYEDFFEGGPV